MLAAVKVTVCAVFCTEKDDGIAVRPEGKPEMAIATAPAKPFCGVIETWKVDEVPGAIEGVDGVASMVKDGGGDGGGWLFDPAPQPASVNPKQKLMRIDGPLAIQRPDLSRRLRFIPCHPQKLVYGVLSVAPMSPISPVCILQLLL